MSSKYVKNELVVGNYYDFTIGSEKYHAKLVDIDNCYDYNEKEYTFAMEKEENKVGDETVVRTFTIQVVAHTRNLDQFELTSDETEEIDDVPENDVNKVISVEYGYLYEEDKEDEWYEKYATTSMKGIADEDDEMGNIVSEAFV